jgi:magnesium chelatase family protein
LDVLRQPLEDRIVTISRASGSLTFPANFTLIAAMNPCPYDYYGYHGDIDKSCICLPGGVPHCQKPISTLLGFAAKVPFSFWMCPVLLFRPAHDGV